MTADRENNDAWAKGRGASSNPTSRFDRLSHTPDPGEEPGSVPTQYFRDSSRTILSDNDSPDILVPRTLNPYRGCTHGCAYCYARPMHEYLGLSPGLDFESKIFVKENAPELLREAMSKPSYRSLPIALSGATDPYQFVEKELQLTRRCLRVMVEFRQAVCVITKSALVERDADLLSDLARDNAARVAISLTTLDADLQRKLEPRASTPRARLQAMRSLAEAGVPVSVNVAPVIPGLTDHEIPAILKAAAEAGASSAMWVMLRLPHGVKDLFAEWLEHHAPLRKEKVLSKLRQLHGGKLYDSSYGNRTRGSGPIADQVVQLFNLHCRRNSLNEADYAINTSAFRRPHGQLELF